MKILAGLLAGMALVCTPVMAEARGGGGGGGHAGGGGMHAGGGFRGGYGGYRGGFRGGYYGGYRGGYGYGWGWPFYGAALGLYLGYYDDPWYWGYPGYYYGSPYPGNVPPVANSMPAPTQAVPQSAPQVCGNWQWGAADQQYHWVSNGCN